MSTIVSHRRRLARPRPRRGGAAWRFAAGAALSVLAGCSGGSTEPEALTALPPGTWDLVAFVAGPGAEAEAPEVLSTLVIPVAEGRISGLAGCNRYTAAYDFEDERLTIGAVAATKRMCPEPEMDQEARFLALLGRATSARRDGDAVVIHTVEGEAMRFARGGESISSPQR